MSETVFREAVSEPVTKTEPIKTDKTPGVADGKDSSSKLVATYEDSVGHPYVAQYYEITNIWKEPKGGFESEVRTIESYIKDMVSDDRMDNSTEAADKWLRDLERKADVDKTESTATKLIRMAAYIRMQRDIESAMKWRQSRV